MRFKVVLFAVKKQRGIARVTAWVRCLNISLDEYTSTVARYLLMEGYQIQYNGISNSNTLIGKRNAAILIEIDLIFR